MVQIVLITGCSSGIGLASAKFFYNQGWNVIATMRSPEKDTVLRERTKMFQKIDLLINNAGYGQNGVFEMVSQETIRTQFDVNVFGVMEVIRAILPHLRANKAGGIINVSSGAGLYTLPMISIYCASKFALEGFTEALSYELSSQNIFIKSVIPHGGVTSTSFNDHGKDGIDSTPDLLQAYGPWVQKTAQAFQNFTEARRISSDDVAKVIYEAATDGTDKLRYLVGNDTRGFIKARYQSKSDEEYISFMRAFFK